MKILECQHQLSSIVMITEQQSKKGYLMDHFDKCFDIYYDCRTLTIFLTVAFGKRRFVCLELLKLKEEAACGCDRQAKTVKYLV